MFKLIPDSDFNRYFSAAKGGVWLIVLPAIVIVIFYFLNTFTEIVIQKERSKMIDYEKRFAALKKDLPAYAFVNFISNQDFARDYLAVRYVLIPARLVRGLKPQHEYLVAQVSDPNNPPTYKGYALKKDYGNGVMLFTRGVD